METKEELEKKADELLQEGIADALVKIGYEMALEEMEKEAWIGQTARNLIQKVNVGKALKSAKKIGVRVGKPAPIAATKAGKALDVAKKTGIRVGTPGKPSVIAKTVEKAKGAVVGAPGKAKGFGTDMYGRVKNYAIARKGELIAGGVGAGTVGAGVGIHSLFKEKG